MLSQSLVASSIASSRRTSPVAGSLSLRLGNLEESGGAWLILRARNEEDAREKLHSRLASPSGEHVWDIGRATIESLKDLDQDVSQRGPLFSGNAEGSTSE